MAPPSHGDSGGFCGCLSGSVTSGHGSVAAGAIDSFLNGSLVDDDVPVTTLGLQANGFRIYQVNLGNFEVDNIRLSNTFAVPEPSTFVLAGLGLVAGCSLGGRRLRGTISPKT